MTRRLITTAVALPLLAISAGILHAELTFARTHDFMFEITGYDPRDLLRGRYLQFRLQLEPFQADRCTAAADSCCACLTQAGDFELAGVARTTCRAARSCDGWLEPEVATQTFRFYVPDAQATTLERKLMDAVVRRAAHARIAVASNGQAHVRMLLVDGQPILPEREHPAK